MFPLLPLVHAAQSTASSAGTSGLGALGLDVKLLVFQIINFAILLFILSKIAYRPILKVLDERRQKIEQSLQDAKTIETTRHQLRNEQQQLMKEAQEKAQLIIDESHKQGEQIIAQAETAARERVTIMQTEAEAKIKQATQEAKQHLRHETLHLIAQATERILAQKIDQEKDAALIRQMIEESETSHKHGARV